MPYQVVASTGEKSADVAVKSGSGTLWGAQLNGASAAATLVLYDGADATGKKLCELESAIDGLEAITFPAGLSFGDGLFADVTGVGATYVAWYE